MFTKEEREAMIMALQMRRNYIQTGSVTFSVRDVERMGPVAAGEFGIRICPLSDAQMQCVIDANKLIDKLIHMEV